jgi:hypothetical protein
MSNTTATPVAPVTPQTPDPSTPVETNRYAAMADSMIAQFRAMQDQVPRFTLPPSKPISRKLIANASVPDVFIAIAGANLVKAPQLGTGIGANADELRDVMHYAISFGTVAKESAAWTAAVEHSVADARHKAGTDALNVYALAKRLVKKPGYEWLVPVVAEMQQALGRKKPHPRKKTTAVSTTPASAPESTTTTPEHTHPAAAEKLS